MSQQAKQLDKVSDFLKRVETTLYNVSPTIAWSDKRKPGELEMVKVLMMEAGELYGELQQARADWETLNS